MFRMSITIGAKPDTRESTAEVSQVVQPRLEAPVTVKVSSSSDHSRLANSWAASMPRTALLTIGSNSGHSASLVRRYSWNVWAIASSSNRPPKIG